jgi:Methyltransferase domain
MMTKINYRRWQWNILSRRKPNSTRGAEDYLDVLRAIHRSLKPGLYVEVGIRHGKSLSMALGPAIGVDPAPEITVPLAEQVQVFAKTSDDFFTQDADKAFARPIDLAFIDGMHWFEFALRDFMNIERHSQATSLVVFDDIFPSHPLQAQRNRQTRVWTGDIWRIIGCLRYFRPDLVLVPIDTHPTGLLLVAGLDHRSRQLVDHYEEIVGGSEGIEPTVPHDLLNRQGVWPPSDPRICGLLELLRESREASEPDDVFRQRLRAWREPTGL